MEVGVGNSVKQPVQPKPTCIVPDFGEAVYNVVMVGNSSVGKTSFIKRLQTGQFTQDYSSTIGESEDFV